MTRRQQAGESKTDESHKPAGGTPEASRKLPEITFEDLSDQLQDAARQMGWTALLPVQAKAIPYLRSASPLHARVSHSNRPTWSTGA